MQCIFVLACGVCDSIGLCWDSFSMVDEWSMMGWYDSTSFVLYVYFLSFFFYFFDDHCL